MGKILSFFNLKELPFTLIASNTSPFHSAKKSLYFKNITHLTNENHTGFSIEDRFPTKVGKVAYGSKRPLDRFETQYRRRRQR